MRHRRRRKHTAELHEVGKPAGASGDDAGDLVNVARHGVLSSLAIPHLEGELMLLLDILSAMPSPPKPTTTLLPEYSLHATPVPSCLNWRGYGFFGMPADSSSRLIASVRANENGYKVTFWMCEERAPPQGRSR